MKVRTGIRAGAQVSWVAALGAASVILQPTAWL